MSSEDTNEKAKSILIKMNNSEINLERFYDLLEAETSGKLSKISLNVLLNKHYKILDDGIIKNNIQLIENSS